MQRLYFTLCCLCFMTGLSAQYLVEASSKGSRSKAYMQNTYGDFMGYGVKLYKIVYNTVDVHGEPTVASGLLSVPDDQGLIYPLAAYQHGTVDGPADVPSNLAGGYELGLVLGGLGYITVAPDFLGLGDNEGIHPYVHSESEATAAIDLLRAAKEYCTANDIYFNDQLFLTGYSQGGHASAALQHELEDNYTDEFTVTAASHLSGPYSISGVMLDLILGDEPYGFVAYLANTAISYDEVYGIYNGDVNSFFQEPYATEIAKYRDDEIGLIELNTTLLDMLAANAPAPLTKYLMQDSIRSILEARDSTHPVMMALLDNDEYNWTPQAPTRIYYCTADDQVPFMNSVLAGETMNALGAPDVLAFDVDPTADHGGCVNPAVVFTSLFFGGFQEIEAWTGVPELSAPDLKVFPNPVSDRLIVKGIPENTHVELLSVDGRVLRSGWSNLHELEIDTQELPVGMYTLRLTRAEQVLTKRVAKGH